MVATLAEPLEVVGSEQIGRGDDDRVDRAEEIGAPGRPVKHGSPIGTGSEASRLECSDASGVELVQVGLRR